MRKSNHESFKSLYSIKLKPILLILDKERRVILYKVRKLSVISVILFLVAFSYVVIIELEWDLEGIWWCVFILSYGLYNLLYHIRIKPLEQDYQASFKKEIVTPLVYFFDKSFVYQAKARVFWDELEASDIFLGHIGLRGVEVEADDYVSGKIGNTAFEFSDIKLTVEGGDSTTTVFQGLFFSIDFNKNFNGRTFVLTDYAERAFGLIGQELQSIISLRGELIRLESEEFEEQFVVYSDDQIEARYILSPSFMEKILELKNTTNNLIEMSFVKNKLYIALSKGKGSFEPKLHESIVDFNDIQTYYDDLTLVLDLVEILNLNRRVWGKSKPDNTWLCKNCNEVHELIFDSCWKCLNQRTKL